MLFVEEKGIGDGSLYLDLNELLSIFIQCCDASVLMKSKSVGKSI